MTAACLIAALFAGVLAPEARPASAEALESARQLMPKDVWRKAIAASTAQAVVELQSKAAKVGAFWDAGTAEALQQIIEERAPYEALVEENARLLERKLTAQELAQVRAFQEGTTGRKLLELAPQLTANAVRRAQELSKSADDAEVAALTRAHYHDAKPPTEVFVRPPAALPGEKRSADARVETLLTAYESAYNVGSAEAIASLFTPDCLLLGANGQVTRGRADVQKLFAYSMPRVTGWAVRFETAIESSPRSDEKIVAGTYTSRKTDGSQLSGQYLFSLQPSPGGGWAIAAASLSAGRPVKQESPKEVPAATTR